MRRVLEHQRLDLVAHLDPLDRLGGRDHLRGARMQVARVLEVVRQALAEARRLADVDHPAVGVLELVRARGLGDRAGRGTFHHLASCMTPQAYGRPDTVMPDVRPVRRRLPPTTQRRLVPCGQLRRHHHRHPVRPVDPVDVPVGAVPRRVGPPVVRSGAGSGLRGVATRHVADRHRAGDLAAARDRLLLPVRPAARSRCSAAASSWPGCSRSRSCRRSSSPRSARCPTASTS